MAFTCKPFQFGYFVAQCKSCLVNSNTPPAKSMRLDTASAHRLAEKSKRIARVSTPPISPIQAESIIPGSGVVLKRNGGLLSKSRFCYLSGGVEPIDRCWMLRIHPASQLDLGHQMSTTMLISKQAEQFSITAGRPLPHTCRLGFAEQTILTLYYRKRLST